MNDIRTKVGNENDKVEVVCLAIQDHDSLGIYVDINDSMYIKIQKDDACGSIVYSLRMSSSNLVSYLLYIIYLITQWLMVAVQDRKAKIGTK